LFLPTVGTFVYATMFLAWAAATVGVLPDRRLRLPETRGGRWKTSSRVRRHRRADRAETPSITDL